MVRGAGQRNSCGRRRSGARRRAKFLLAAGPGVRAVTEQFQGVTRSARSKHFSMAMIDPPVTEDERLTDALAAFGLLCDRAIEYLDLFTWGGATSSGADGSTSA